MEKIVVNANNDHERQVLKKLIDDFPEYKIVFPTNKDDLMKELKDAEILAGYFINKEMLDVAQSLKYVCGFLAGVDKLPLDILNKRNILLTTGRGIHPIHMSEYAIAMMVLDARNLDKVLEEKKEKNWTAFKYPQDQIYGKKLGILGIGAIGKELARKADAFGMEVIGIKKHPQAVEYVSEVYNMEEGLDVVFSTCDYIVNLLPNTEETNQIINKKYLSMMKNTACMINIGRGDTVNEEDLYDALKNKQFKRYISDVFVTEPLPKESKFWELDNIVITPHLCGPNITYMDKAYPIVAHNLKCYLKKDFKNMKNMFSYELGY